MLCALNSNQIKMLYGLTSKAMESDNFSPNDFMQRAFDHFKKATENSNKKFLDPKDVIDPIENAARYVEQIPLIIAQKLIVDDPKHLRDLSDNINKLTKLRREFLDDPSGRQNVIDMFTSKASNVIDSIAIQKKKANSPEQNVEDPEKPTDIKVTPPERLETKIVLSGTSMDLIRRNNSNKLFVETIDDSQTTNINSINALKQAFNTTDTMGRFEYKGMPLRLSAVRLDKFANTPNRPSLSSTTEDEISRSFEMIDEGKAKKEVFQNNERIILLVADEFGEYVYFDKDGNVTDEANGKVVYQFLRPIRKDKNGKLKVTNIYGYDAIASPEKIAKDSNLALDEVKEILKQEYNSLYKFSQDVIKNPDQVKFLDIDGFSRGVTPQVIGGEITLEELAKLPGMSIDTLAEQIELADEATAQQYNIAEGTAVIPINGMLFPIQRPFLSDNLINEIAEVATNTKFSDLERQEFIEQFLDNSLTDTVRQYVLNFENGNFKVEVRKSPLNKDIDIDNPVIDLSKEALDTDTKVQSAKNRLSTLLASSYYWKNPESSSRSANSFTNLAKRNWQPTPMIFNKKNINDKQLLRLEDGELVAKSYTTIIKDNPAITIRLNNLDPGFYNVSILFKDPYSESTIDQKEADTEVRSDIRRTKDNLVDYIKDNNVDQIETTISLVNDSFTKLNRIRLNNPSVQTEETIFFTNTLRVVPLEGLDYSKIKEGDKVILKLVDREKEEFKEGKPTGNVLDITDEVVIYLKKGKTLEEIGNIGETTFSQETPREYPIIQEVDEAITTDNDINGNLGTDSPNLNIEDSIGDNMDLYDKEGDPEVWERSGYKLDAVTRKQIDDALEWWKNSPLSRHIDLKRITNIVNSDQFATFVVNAAALVDPTLPKGTISLFDKGSAVDLYHEAWHGFSQLYLSTKEKRDLYNEVKKIPKYKDYSYFEVEELLAEEFRSYAKNPKVKKGSPKRNTIFRKILNFINALLNKIPGININKKDAINDVLSVPAVNELFTNLYLGSKFPSRLNKYSPTVQNKTWTKLNRGIKRTKQEDALDKYDSGLVVKSMDSIFSTIVDKRTEYLQTKNSTNTYATTLALVSSGKNLDLTYVLARKAFEKRLENLDDQLIKDSPSFNKITTLSELEKNAAAVIETKDPTEVKYVFLKNQIDSFDNLNADIEKGSRVMGENYMGMIPIITDFYTHDTIQVKEEGKKATNVSIIVADSVETAQKQFNNYIVNEETSWKNFKVLNTDVVNTIPLSQKQQSILNQIRIIQTTLNNWDNVINYHKNNSRYSIIDSVALQEKKDIEEENDNDLAQDEVIKNVEGLQDKKLGKKSHFEMAEETTRYIVKSLHRVDADGKTYKDELGFKQLADDRRIWATLTNVIGGIKSPQAMYEKLKDSAENFPEIDQLITYKLPKPEGTQNSAELKIIAGFWQTFKKHSLTYYQNTAFAAEEDLDTDGIELNFKEKKHTIAVAESERSVNAITRDFKTNFNQKIPSKYIKKVKGNISVLELSNIVNDFGKNGVLNFDKSLEFLNALGIELDNIERIKNEIDENYTYLGIPFIYKVAHDFSKLEERDLKNLTEEQLEFLKKFKFDPIGTLTSTIPAKVLVNTWKGKAVNQNTSVKRLARVQATYGSVSSVSGILTADGKLVYPHIEDTSASMIVDGLNSLKNLKDAYTNKGNNKLGDFNYLSQFNEVVNPFTKRSQLLNSVYAIETNEFSKRRGKSLRYFVMSGTSVADDESLSTATADLNKYAKFTQQLHSLLLRGVKEAPRIADKKSTFGIKVNGGLVKRKAAGTDSNLFIDSDLFLPGKDGFNYGINNIILPYVATEFERIKKVQENKEYYKKILGYNRPMGNGKIAGEVFTIFDDILSKDVKEKLYNLDIPSSVDLVKYLKTNPTLQQDILNDLSFYFNNQIENNKEYLLEESPFMGDTLINKLNLQPLPKDATLDQRIERSKIARNAIMASYTMNAWIYDFEVNTLLNGDMVQFNHDKADQTKRIYGVHSGGPGFMYDQNTRNFINNVFHKTSYAQKQYKIKDSFVYDGTFKTDIIKDSVQTSIYINEIEKGLTKYYKGLPFKFTNAQIKSVVESQVEAYEDMDESDGGGYITFDAYRTFKFLQGNWGDEQEVLYQKIINGEPITREDVTSYFPIYKLQYYGPLANTKSIVTANHKFALTPLIPGVISKEEEALHKQMMENSVQYLSFGTGSKVGAVTSNGKVTDIYNEEGGVKEGINFIPNIIYPQYLKEVASGNEKYKRKITSPTQMRAILLDALYNNGELINSDNKEVVNKYENAVKKYSTIVAFELLNEIGFRYDKDSKKYTYTEDGLTKLMSLVQNELGQKEMPEALKQLVNVTENGNRLIDLSVHPTPGQIETTLFNILQKRLVKHKVPGESLIMTPVTLSKSLWQPYKKATSNEAKMLTEGTNGLRFYTADPKTGKTLPMNIAIALQGDFFNLLELKHDDGDKIGSRERLNEMIKNSKWLDVNRESITLTGPRIPTDATNSVEVAEIWHFFDPTGGNQIMLPSEVVAKEGADFDFDKLFFMYPKLDSSGKVIKTNYNKTDLIAEIEKGSEKASVLIEQQKYARHNELIKSITDLLTLSDLYPHLIKPNQMDLVKQILPFVQDIETGYDKFEPTFKENIRKDKNSNVFLSPTRTLEQAFDIDQHEANLTGGITLGISAKRDKMHPVYKSIGFVMPEQIPGVKVRPKNKKFEKNLTVMYPADLPFNTNKIDNNISLSGEWNEKGERISSVQSDELNAILDRTKDPFIISLGANPEAINVINYLMEAGVDQNIIFALMKQPLVKQYYTEQQRRSNPYNFMIPGVDNDNNLNYINQKVGVKRGSFEAVINNLDNRINPLLEGAEGVNAVRALENAEQKANIEKQKQIDTDIFYDTGWSNPSNVYLMAGYLIEDQFKNGKVTLDILKNNLTDYKKNKKINAKDVALLYLIKKIEQQTAPLALLGQVESPDTTYSKTAIDLVNKNSLKNILENLPSLDKDSVKRLLNNSVLASFNKNNVMLDIYKTLFTLRSNEEIQDFIRASLNDKDVKNKFGTTAEGREIYSSLFNNAILNSLFQNMVSNSTDTNGVVIDIPESFKRSKVKEVTTGKEVEIKNGVYNINVKLARKNFSSYEATFNTFSNYINYKLQIEYIKDTQPIEKAKDNIRFKHYLNVKNTKAKAYQAFVVERALMNSYNRGFIFGTGQHGYSYTDMILQTINQYPELSNKFPMLEQLREANLVNRKEKVLEMINQRDVTGDLANDYNRQLRSLSNPSISKTDNIKNDIAISEIFSLFSLMMTYQHGVGFSRFSFNNVIDPKQYIEHINTAKDNFLKSFNKEKKPGELTELEKIQKLFMRDNMFQNYLVKSDEEIAGILDESMTDLNKTLAEKLAINITEEDAQPGGNKGPDNNPGNDYPINRTPTDC